MAAVSRIVATGIALGFLLGASWTFAQPVQDVPVLRERVTDLTGTLSGQVRSALVSRLKALEDETGSQAAVLVVETTAPEPIEAYALRVVEAWKLGRENIDDGVLLLVAMNDRRMRIEVGYGLEGALPDARAKRIIEDIIAPKFLSGDYTGGIEAGVDAIAAVVRGEPLPRPEPRQPDAGSDIFSLLPVILIVSVMLGGSLKRSLGTLPGSIITGGIAGFIGWLLVGLLGAAILAGIVGFLITLFTAIGPGSWSSSGHRRGRYGGGFGGGGFGGGGFGGGGGSFGGGGASGSW
jgi:uncharacterized protein